MAQALGVGAGLGRADRVLPDQGPEFGEVTGQTRLTAYGTLYKALDRMERAGYLESRWEDPHFAAQEARPRRRLYGVTALGERALADALAGDAPATAPRPIAHPVDGEAS